uniref:Uncharacterized protein n=1 Tax=Haemonchus contortus TaxID=6289 RepID=A0A7I4XT02_HAECO
MIGHQLISCNPSPHFQVLFPLNLTCKTVPGFRVHRSKPRVAEWLRDDLQADWNACRRVAHLPVQTNALRCLWRRQENSCGRQERRDL